MAPKLSARIGCRRIVAFHRRKRCKQFELGQNTDFSAPGKAQPVGYFVADQRS